ncbi:pis1 [Symbiodinium sp. CCMP2456]|nr:pis1 [Symbiodinium sp. CCMP2456]
MAARNPGPFLQQTPVGFPSYTHHIRRDWLARKAFEKSEVNTRVYKAIYENMGVRGSIPINKYVGRNRIRLRGITEGFARGNKRQIFQNISADCVKAVLRTQEADPALPAWKPGPSAGFRFVLPGRDVTEERLTELDGRPQKPAMEALNTRKDFRRWKRRRKQDGGRNRHFRLKYG